MIATLSNVAVKKVRNARFFYFWVYLIFFWFFKDFEWKTEVSLLKILREVFAERIGLLMVFSEFLDRLSFGKYSF